MSRPAGVGPLPGPAGAADDLPVLASHGDPVQPGNGRIVVGEDDDRPHPGQVDLVERRRGRGSRVLEPTSTIPVSPSVSVPSVRSSWADGADPAARNPDRRDSRMTLDEALRIAVDAHAGQLDKAGKPYVPHDVVVDSDWTVESLDAKFGLDPEEQAVLRLLTHGDDEDCDACVERLSEYLRSLPTRRGWHPGHLRRER